MTKSYTVTIPIAGHITFEVQAESEEAAKEIARTTDVDEGVTEWETLDKFNQGNVCYCPSPWEITVKENN